MAISGWPVRRMRTRVLLVEEQPDSDFSLVRMLHHFDCDYDICQVGTEAVARAMGFLPHLVFLDMELLRADGYAVAAALRHQAITQPMIVAITCQGAKSRLSCEGSGVDFHVFRPIELATLRLLLTEGGWDAHGPTSQRASP
jgi:CheY-like chemotaxis protein